MKRRAQPETEEGGFVPPHSIEAEQAVLGGLMISPERFTDIDWLKAEDFWRRDHQLIFRAIGELIRAERPVDAITLGEWFEDQGIAELVGGTRYIVEVAGSTPSASNVIVYAEIVRDKARLRACIDAGNAIIEKARAKGVRAIDIVSQAQHELAGLEVESRIGGAQPIKKAAQSWFEDLTKRWEQRDTIKLSGLATPWENVNKLLDGLQPGLLYLVAGRPGMGKTVLAVQWLIAVSAFAHTLGFSLEMKFEDLVQRAVAMMAGIEHEHLRRVAELPDDDWSRITEAMVRINALDLVVDDQPGLTPFQIVARIKRQHLKKPIKLVVIDHFHEMSVDRKVRNALGDGVKMIRDCCKTLRIPCLGFAQLNRSVTKRDNKRPEMEDLRDDGGLEEAADVIIFLHREEYYDQETHLKEVVEIIIGKGRNMPRGHTAFLRNQLNQMRFIDWLGDLPRPKPKDESTTVTRKRPNRKTQPQSTPQKDQGKSRANDDDEQQFREQESRRESRRGAPEA